ARALRRELLEGREEVAGRRLLGRRQLGCHLQPGIEVVRAELDVVAVALVAESNVERDDAPVRKALPRVREVRRRVEDDGRVLGCQLHAACPAASWIAATISSRSS